MKASVYTRYGPPEVLQLTDVDKPEPKDNEVLIKIHATTVTAVDSIFRKGDQFFARMATGPMKPKAHVLGTELSGTIEAIGKHVKNYNVGDAVFGDSSPGSGTHAEYICLPENGVITTKPDDLSWEEAAAIPYGTLTALPFIRDEARLKAGQQILIIGASGAVGSFAVQLAKYYQAEVTGVCSSAHVQMVKALGADHVIDYTNEDFTKRKQIYDIVFDTVGKSTFARCKKVLSPHGKYLTTVIGLPILLQMLSTSIAGRKKARIAFTGMRPAADRKKDLEFIKGLAEAGRIKPVIDKSYPLEQIAGAHRYVDRGHKKGSVVINVSGNE